MIFPNASPPMFFDYKNRVDSAIQNHDIHVTNTGLSRFYQRYFLQRAISVFEWKCPKTWAKNYFQYLLYCFGYFAIINTDKFGVIPQQCGLSGYTVQYQPSHAIIASKFFAKTLEPRIDKDCILMRLQPDYGGIMDIITTFADMMALTVESLATNLFNSKLAYVFAADRKAVAESFKHLFDDIASGKPAVVIDKELLTDDGSLTWQYFSQDLKANYLAGDLINEQGKINRMFDTFIGIPNSNTDKRERLITDEVTSNNFETKSLASLWLSILQEDCEKARDMFGIDLSVDWNPEIKAGEKHVDESESSRNSTSSGRNGD